MKYLFIAFLFISSISYGQGIEPSSFQPTPYLGGVLRGVTPFVDEFTGQTYYLYVHDSLDAAVPYVDTIFMTDFNLYYIKNGDTIYVGSVTDSSFIYNVVSDTFALDMDIDSTNELQELFHEDNILVLTGAGPDSQVDLTPYMDVDSIYMQNYNLWYTKSGESGTPRFVGNVTDSSYIHTVVSDSIAAIVFPSDSTLVENDYGTIIVESPDNTFGVTVDSSLYMTTYDGTLKENYITPGTTSQYWRGDKTWQTTPSGTVTGTGTDNYIPKWNGTTALENSIMYDSGSSIGIGTSSPYYRLDISGTSGTVGIRTSSNTAGDILNYGTGTVTGDLNYLYTSINASGFLSNEIINNNTSTGSSRLILQVPNSSSGDPFMLYTTSGAQNWVHGIDNSDSDKFKIGPYTTPSTATQGESLVLTTDGKMGWGNSSPSYKFQIEGTKNTVGLSVRSNTADDILMYGLGTVTGDIRFFESNLNASGTLMARLENGNTSTGRSKFEIQVPNSSTGDPMLTFTTGGAQNWVAGIDNSDSDKFKISNTDSPSSGFERIVITTDSKVGIVTNSPQRTLHVGGELRIDDLTTTTPTKLMSVDNDGVVSSLGLSGLSISGGNLTNSFNGDITAVTVTAPIIGGGTSGSVNIAIDTARADGSSKGAASFAAADFNSSAGNITIDYANGQEATSGVDGFLKSSDWTTFNNKFTLPSLTSGSVLISDGSTISQENAQLFWDFTNNRLGIGTNLPTNTLSVAGVVKVTGSASGNTVLWGRHPSNFTMGAITVGSGLTLSGDNLSSTATGTVTSVGLSAGTGISIGGTNPVTTSGTISVTNTAPNVNANLTFSGASSPVSLNSSDGTDVTFTAGTGISLTGTSTNLTINNTSSGTYAYWRLSANSGTAFAVTDNTLVNFNNSTGISWTRTASTGEMTATLADNSATNEIQNLGYNTGTRLLSIDGTGSTDVTLPLVTSTIAGLVSAYPNNTTSFLRGDGNWATPPTPAVTGSAPIVVTSGNISLNIGTGLYSASGSLTNLSTNYGYLFHSSGTIGGQSISTTPLTVNFNDQMQGFNMTCNTSSDYVQVTNSGGYEIDYGVCVGGISSTRQISVQVYVGSSSVAGTLKRFFIDSGDEDCAHGKHVMDLTAGQQVFLKVATSGSETATFDGPQLKVTRIY